MSIVHSLRIPIEKSFVSGFLHANSTISEGQPFVKAGVVLVSGAGGGVYGPTGIWMSLATRLAQAGVPTIRLDYRRPNHTQTCVADLEAAIHFLHSQFGIQIVGLVGWSFGSAPVFTMASKMMEKGNGKIVRLGACATVAAQTADSFGIRQCSPNVPILLVHGTNDRCLSFECSIRLKAEYDRGDPGKRGKCEVLLMEGDDHCLTHQYARAEQHILDFLLDALLGEAQQTNAVDHSLVPSAKTGLDWMQRGHDLGEAPDGMGERESVNEPTRHQKND